jgi:hypothetical protein
MHPSARAVQISSKERRKRLVKLLGTEFLLGCDPEVFVKNRKGELVGAWDLMPGTKMEPYKVPEGMVQVDGMALEFGVDPCSTKEEFIYRVNSVKATLKKMLPKGYSLALQPVAHFSEEEMKRAPAAALELGCDPDYCAYTGKKNPAPALPTPNMRSAGGHVHIGWGKDFDRLSKQFIEGCCPLAAELDYYLGIPSLHWDSNQERRAIYGAPGAFRPKSYGMEYRSLSNQWLNSDELIGFVFDATVKGIRSVMSAPVSVKDVVLFHKNMAFEPRTAINKNFKELGRDLYKKLKRGFDVQ